MPKSVRDECMKYHINKNGFTIIEVITVLVILGIFAAVAISQISSNQNNLITARDTLVSQLRLAQARAMSTSTDDVNTFSAWGVRFVSTTTYHLFYCADASACNPADAANQKIFFGADSIIMNLAPKGVQVTTNGSGIIAFDRFGIPYDSIASIPTNNSRTTQLILTLQDSNGKTKTINITPQTGMITS
jgi:prepilin-type N-terminal cleavage/methylation domain-containing protein